jgi:hypothetical protein
METLLCKINCESQRGANQMTNRTEYCKESAALSMVVVVVVVVVVMVHTLSFHPFSYST